MPCMLNCIWIFLFINLSGYFLEIARGGYVTWGFSSRTKKTWGVYNGPSRKHEIKQPCLESYGNWWSKGKTKEKSRISAEERIEIKRQDIQWAFNRIAGSLRIHQQIHQKLPWLHYDYKQQQQLSQLQKYAIHFLLISWETFTALCWKVQTAAVKSRI